MIDGWFVVRSFLTENPKFSAHIFALPLDVNVPHSVEQKARLSRGGVVFHSKVFTIARELVFRERLGKEVSRVELGADVPNANRKISNVVTDLEIARIKMFGTLARLRIVHGELHGLVVDSNRRRRNSAIGRSVGRDVIAVTIKVEDGRRVNLVGHLGDVAHVDVGSEREVELGE